MNSELIVKDVEFHGDMLRAAQDPDGKVWVGVRWMCQGIGFGEDKIDNERKKIQKDVVISQGVKFHSLGSGNSNTKVLCLDLDYVPLWLAKIAITPTMQRENPVLVNKLIDYQLKAKDVLAAAFLGDKKTTEEIVPVYKPQGNMIQLQFPDIQMPTIPDYSNRLDEINNKIDKLYTEIGKFATAMMNKNADPVKLNNAIPVKKEDKKKVVSPTEQEYYDWKKRTNEFVDKLSESSKFTDRNSVLKYLYDYINKTYGIVWDQEKREYRRRHSNISKVSTFDVIYEDEQLRSIFDCTLADMAEKYKNQVIYAEREILGELPEGVYYIADLIGLDIVTEDGEKIGTVSDVFNTGSNDIYEVKREGKKNLLLPVIDDVVLNIDVDGGKITVRMMDGLEDLA